MKTGASSKQPSVHKMHISVGSKNIFPEKEHTSLQKARNILKQNNPLFNAMTMISPTQGRSDKEKPTDDDFLFHFEESSQR